MKKRRRKERWKEERKIGSKGERMLERQKEIERGKGEERIYKERGTEREKDCGGRENIRETEMER